MCTNEINLIHSYLNLINEIKIIENNTKDENISYELKKIRTTHLKKIEQLGAKIRLVDGFYLFFKYTPSHICKL